MSIHVQGAAEHNLQSINVDFGDGLTVVTGVSGSGKTSLVFDTLYHEARRRFLEIYSLGSSGLRLSPARVEAITGLGPAVAVGQNLLNRNPNSTLATASGLHPLLRLLYANFGERYCPNCQTGLTVLSEDEIVERLVSLAAQGPLTVFAPLLRQARGSHSMLLELLAAEFGAEALRIDGRAWQQRLLGPAEAHDIEVELAHWTGAVSARQARQLVQMGAALGVHALIVRREGQTLALAQAPVCTGCGTWFDEGVTPVHFHTPCPHCAGEGCEPCGETGLHPMAAAVRWQGLRLPELLACSVDEVRQRFASAEWPTSATRLQTEIGRRLKALDQVGLGYITLDRPSPTLSRGEAQRVRLAVVLTSRLEDMLHVLDEPTIGQHPADVARLLPAFRELNGPVVYVEHDRIAAALADQAIDLGPGAGGAGGHLLFSGTPVELWETDSPTGHYFSLRKRVLTPEPRPEPEAFLTIHGAKQHNLQNIDVSIPLGRLTVITGVSGSGKSTLVEDVLVASLIEQKPAGCQSITGPTLKPVWVDQNPIGRNPRSNPATYTNLAALIRDYFAAHTPLSASYFSFNRPEGACPDCKGMGAIEIRMRYLASTWIPCATCDGQRFSDEVLSVKAPFGDRQLSIADVYNMSIAEFTPLLLEQGALPEKSRWAAKRILEALDEVGLEYLSLGQPSPTLSGGEAQRLKLAKHLGKRSLARQLLILDEPSTGLHPQNVAGLLKILDRLVRRGATVIIVEHNTDIIRAADWVIDLGPGAGPAGGEVVYAGPPEGLTSTKTSLTGQALQKEAATQSLAPSPPLFPPHWGGRRGGERGPGVRAFRSAHISIRGAYAHNLKGVDVAFPKGALTVVTGVSGSGKSSLVGDVLEAEAKRRFLESLSLYERQSTREGPEAPVETVTGLGVAVTIGPERRLRDRRATVGTATELAHHLAVLYTWLGERHCPACGSPMRRGVQWDCPQCEMTLPIAEPRHFSPFHYAAACQTCQGLGTLREPNPAKLIIQPEKPLCAGAMYSPGFFPQGFLDKPFNSGYYLVQALAERYNFDPMATPWNQMTHEAQQAFLFGDPEPMTVTYHSRNGRMHTRKDRFPGFYGWVRDWDVGGTYTDTQVCPTCQGARLRPQYLAVTLAGHTIHALSEMPLIQLAQVLENISPPETSHHLVEATLGVARRRLRFLLQVGLGYLHLNRDASTLSAGEAQRVKLAGLLGSGLTSLTVLLDEPSRGLHPNEVEALLTVLLDLRNEGNTVIVVEHELSLMRAADYLVDMGPGAGVAGGEIVVQGKPAVVSQADTPTARWLRGERNIDLPPSRWEPQGWLTIRGARANNLRGETVRLPLGALVGICGVSGSGKSTLLIDTLGRILAPRKQTTSVAYEPIEPGPYEAIEGAPARAILVDQARSGVTSPANFLGLVRPLQALFAASDDAQALGLDEKQLTRRCSVCKGSGMLKTDMGFLPAVHSPCEACQGSGYSPEAWEVRLQGLSLPEVFALTVDQVYERFGHEAALTRPLTTMREVGLGYLVLRQPAQTLSGGETQRLKIAKELGRKTASETLYILDEPTVGQHLEDVARLSGVLHRLVDNGHTVLVIEHHPHLLAACDWLIELGPGGGPAGGRVIGTGTPETLATGDTPTAPHLRAILEAHR
jgi:excinuclease ABC subunit A